MAAQDELFRSMKHLFILSLAVIQFSFSVSLGQLTNIRAQYIEK